MSQALNPEQTEELSDCVAAVLMAVQTLQANGCNQGLIDTALILVAGNSVNKNCPAEIQDQIVAQLTSVFTRMAAGATHNGLVQ